MFTSYSILPRTFFMLWTVASLGAHILSPEFLMAQASPTPPDELQKVNKQREQDFYKQLEEKIKRLPASARVIVPELKITVPELASSISDAEVERRRVTAMETFRAISEQIRSDLEIRLENLGIKILERDALKEAEKEIVLSQTGEVDPASSAKFGKAAGATHIIIGQMAIMGLVSPQITLAFSVKIIETESMVRAGSANMTLNIQNSNASVPQQVSCQLTGSWNSDYGFINIVQNGAIIQAAYNWRGMVGKIDGSIEDNNFVRWSWVQSNKDSGVGYWSILPGCRGLVGHWGRTWNVWSGQWNANKMSP